MILHIKNAFFYSIDGFKTTFNDETAFRIIVLQAIIISALMLILPFTYTEQAFLAMSLAITLIVELLNSSLENIVDLITSDWHILAKKTKDMGSAAQFVASASIYVQLALIFLNT